MKNRSNIILVGFMCCGKTTVGRMLSGRLRADFIDIDEMVECREKMSIQKMFDKHGEPYFRESERQIILSLKNTANSVIATGGGSLLLSENLRLLSSIGNLYYLKCQTDILYGRLIKDGGRPLAASLGQSDFNELYEKRRPIYEKCDFKIDCSLMTPEECADEIQKIME